MGPPGTGKTTSILALAHELLGPNYKEVVLELNVSDDSCFNGRSRGLKRDIRAKKKGLQPEGDKRKSLYPPEGTKLLFWMKPTGVVYQTSHFRPKKLCGVLLPWLNS